MAKIVKVTFKPLDILVLSLWRKFSGQAGGCQRPVAPGRCQTFPTGPVRASDPPVTSVRDPLVTDARTSSSPGLIRVLVADDHTFVREGIISQLLRSGRCDVVAEGANGVDAVVLARETRPDVAVLAVSMPCLNGVEVVHRIRAELPATRILVLSIHGSESSRQTIRSCSCDMPFTRGVFLA
jgi:CheY-like chemotaxis protein